VPNPFFDHPVINSPYEYPSRSQKVLDIRDRLRERMELRNILAINDEAHHCYREKPGGDGEEAFKGDEKKEAEKNKEAARLGISGLEAVNRKTGGAPHSIVQ